MTKWNVQYTKKSEKDLESIYEVSRIMDAIEQLDEFPLRYHMYEKEPWKSKGLRVLSYGGRNIDTELNR